MPVSNGLEIFQYRKVSIIRTFTQDCATKPLKNFQVANLIFYILVNILLFTISIIIKHIIKTKSKIRMHASIFHIISFPAFLFTVYYKVHL